MGLANEGNTVLFGACSGSEITIDGEEYLLMNEDEILPEVIQ